ncbi:MAG: hypothetical protein Q9210_000897 [Variospora velana]
MEATAPDVSALIRVTSTEYDEIIATCTLAALSYMDEEDGETIRVGSSLESAQRLDDSAPPFSRSENPKNDVPVNSKRYQVQHRGNPLAIGSQERHQAHAAGDELNRGRLAMEADTSSYQRGCASHSGSPNQFDSSSAVNSLGTNGPLSRSRTTSYGGSRPTLLEVFDGELAKLSSVKPTRNNQRLLAAEPKPLGSPHKTSEFSTRNGVNHLKTAFRSVINRIETLDLKLQSLDKEANESVLPLIQILQHGINAALEGFYTTEQIGYWSVSLPAVGRFPALESFEGESPSNQASNLESTERGLDRAFDSPAHGATQTVFDQRSSIDQGQLSGRISASPQQAVTVEPALAGIFDFERASGSHPRNDSQPPPTSTVGTPYLDVSTSTHSFVSRATGETASKIFDDASATNHSDAATAAQIQECVDQLRDMGFGSAAEGGVSRLVVYAQTAEGNLGEAIDLIAEEKRVYEGM